MAQAVATGRQCLPTSANGRGGTAAAAVLRCPIGRPAGLRLAMGSRQLQAASSAGIWSSSSRIGLQAQRPSSRRQLAMLPPRAAAADAAGSGSTEGGTPPQQPASQPAKRPQLRKPSLQQRMRSAKFAAREAVGRFSHLPPVAALLAALAALNARLQPLYNLAFALQMKGEQLMILYDEFVADETKRVWGWSKRNAKEVEAWSRLPPFLGYFAATLVWQAFMPVSFLAAVAAPLYYAWVLWDDWYVSPVFLATLLTAPMKWVPWADKCLVWPGLI